MRSDRNDVGSAPRSTLDIAWAAGFIEGDGSFFTAGSANSPVVKAGQKTIEPLKKLKSIFGGNLVQTKSKGYEWSICSDLAASVMMTLYVLMSARRQKQIVQSLAHWKIHTNFSRSRVMSRWGFCPRGGARHTVRYRSTTGTPYCLQCNRAYQEKVNARRRATYNKEKAN